MFDLSMDGKKLVITWGEPDMLIDNGSFRWGGDEFIKVHFVQGPIDPNSLMHDALVARAFHYEEDKKKNRFVVFETEYDAPPVVMDAGYAIGPEVTPADSGVSKSKKKDTQVDTPAEDVQV